MLEIVYRIYEIIPYNEDIARQYEERGEELPYFYETKTRHELAMEIMLIESRDKFKESIRSLYGSDIKFTNSKSLQIGDKFCVIIGEKAYSSTRERYFNKKEYVCSHCQVKTTTYVSSEIRINEHSITTLSEAYNYYKDKIFCSNSCLEKFLDIERAKMRVDLNTNEWITKDSFVLDSWVRGYIYKITKKSTGEFYVGQTHTTPIFRWGQHLKTDRFPHNEILDFVFEVIDIVKGDESILEVEKYWIQKLWKEQPDKSLNISNTKKLTLQTEMDIDINEAIS